jgi:hypothetical protein
MEDAVPAAPTGVALASRDNSSAATYRDGGIPWQKPAGQPVRPATAGHAARRTATGSATDRPTDVRGRVSAMARDLAARECELSELAARIEATKQLHQSEVAVLEERCQTSLKANRAECEETVGRQLAFIDELLKEKAEAGKKSAEEVSELEAAEVKWEAKLKQQTEAHKREGKRTKESWNAAEKVRRDKWMTETMAQVKAQTIKGLEPEIERLLAQQKVRKAPSWPRSWANFSRLSL